MINKNEDGREVDNIVYIDTNGTEITSERQYTKFPFDVRELMFLEKGNKMLNVKNPFSGEQYLLSPVEESVYSVIMGAQMIPGYEQNNRLIQMVRDGLNWFRDNNAKAYMALLD
jgi:hypothetical protein